MGFFEQIAVILQRYYPYFLEGVKNTLIIAAMSVVLGVVFGTLMAIMRMCRIKPLKWIAIAYIEFVRGTPLMVQLMFIFYGLPMIGIEFPDVSWIPNFSRFMAGIDAMSINSCAYVAEVIRSGIQAVDSGQGEAARSLGMTQKQAMLHIIMPQAIKNILPAIGNEFVTMIKETSIIQYLGVSDLMYNNGIVITATYNPLPCYYISAIIYLVLNIVLGKGINIFERRLQRSDRK